MPRETPVATPPLSRKERVAFRRLSAQGKAAIDDTILSCALPRWQKVAMLVSRTEEKLHGQYPQFSYALYAERIRLLVKLGRLHSQGELRYMRFSEVKLPEPT